MSDIKYSSTRKSMDFEFGESMSGHDLRIGTSFLPYCKGKLFSDSYMELIMNDFNGDEDRVFLELAKNFLIEIITKYDENRDN